MVIWLVLIGFNLMQIESAFLRYYKSSDDFTVTPLISPLPMLDSTFFDLDLKTIIYAFGYTSSADSKSTEKIKEAYINNIHANFVLLDWEKEAGTCNAGLIHGYTQSAAPNAKKVGDQLGDAILQLVDVGLNLNTLHLVGHSLGAHLVGYAGKHIVKEADKYVGRITGLDPAGPLELRGLEATSGAFIDVLHTAPGTYGTRYNDGHVDVWANCDLSAQPGCDNSLEILIGLAELCSHGRSVEIYAESLSNPTGFPAIQAPNCCDWKNGYHKDDNIIYIGENMDTRARGKFYLSTKAEEPFGKGNKGLQP